jgi:hypothetical protein
MNRPVDRFGFLSRRSLRRLVKREFDSYEIVILLACLGVAWLLVTYWRHIVYLLFQCLSVLIACGGVLILILGAATPELGFVQAIKVWKDYLESFSEATGVLFGVILIFSGIPLMVLFRAICYRLMSWLEIFNYPPALRDAFLATGVRPARDPDTPIFPPRLVKCLAYGTLACVVVFGALIALSLHGVEFASAALETVSHIALVLLCLGMAMLGKRND